MFTKECTHSGIELLLRRTKKRESKGWPGLTGKTQQNTHEEHSYEKHQAILASAPSQASQARSPIHPERGGPWSAQLSVRAAFSPHVVTLPVPGTLPSPPLGIPPTQGATLLFCPGASLVLAHHSSRRAGSSMLCSAGLLAGLDTPRRNPCFKSSNVLPLSVCEQVGGARESGRWPLPPIPALRPRWW